MNEIIEHIKNIYGLELAPCSIPKNEFQYYKRNFYIFILKKVSKKLFYFLKRVLPIKYLTERPDKDIWFYKRNSSGRISIEIEIKPIPIEACIYSSQDSGLFQIANENYKVSIYPNLNGVSQISFPLNHINGIAQIDYYFSKIDELKDVMRDYKLKSILGNG